MSNSFANTTAKDPETILPDLGQSMRTVRVNNDMCLGVIKFDPSSFPAHQLPTEHIQRIAGVYGVCVDETRNTLQILFDGRPETEIHFLLRL
jgi:hypothetical protein